MLLKFVIVICLIFILIYSVGVTFLCRMSNAMKKNKTSDIYITFDDGPDPNYTNKLLDLLKKYNIKVSFFVVAKFAEKNPDIISRMKNEGHLIGFHSLEHRNSLWQTPKYTKYDFEESIKILDKLSVNVHYFRPPWGCFNMCTLSQIKKHNLVQVLWNVMVGDWSGSTTSEIIANKLIKRTKPGDIICLHDGRGKNEAPSRTIQALEKVIPYWISKGYTFKTIDKYKK